MYELNPPNQDIYIVEFERHPGDLGVSLILRAECEVAARLQAWRRFLEYKRIASRTRVSALDYAEVDHESGRVLIMKRKKRPAIPALLDEEPDQDFNNDWQIEEGNLTATRTSWPPTPTRGMFGGVSQFCPVLTIMAVRVYYRASNSISSNG